MSVARELFDLYANGGYEHLLQITNGDVTESLYLEFKVAHSILKKDDRKNLAAALSGFANSDGGIIVWGVVCRKGNDPDVPDVAQDLEPVDDLPLFMSQLQEHSAGLVSPGITGVEHFAIPHPENHKSGFAITYVPASESNLHMAVAVDQHRYYYRTCTSFKPMESYMVADRFGRRPKPKLEFIYSIHNSKTTTGSQGTLRHWEFYFGMRNVGKGLATYPVFAIFQPEELPLSTGIDGNGRSGLAERPRNSLEIDDRWRFFSGGVNDVIYPGKQIWIVKAVYRVGFGDPVPLPEAIKYQLFCDSSSLSGDEHIPREALSWSSGATD